MKRCHLIVANEIDQKESILKGRFCNKTDPLPVEEGVCEYLILDCNEYTQNKSSQSRAYPLSDNPKGGDL